MEIIWKQCTVNPKESLILEKRLLALNRQKSRKWKVTSHLKLITSDKESKPNLSKIQDWPCPAHSPATSARTSHHPISNNRAGKGNGRKSRRSFIPAPLQGQFYPAPTPGTVLSAPHSRDSFIRDPFQATVLQLL